MGHIFHVNIPFAEQVYKKGNQIPAQRLTLPRSRCRKVIGCHGCLFSHQLREPNTKSDTRDLCVDEESINTLCNSSSTFSIYSPITVSITLPSLLNRRHEMKVVSVAECSYIPVLLQATIDLYLPTYITVIVQVWAEVTYPIFLSRIERLQLLAMCSVCTVKSSVCSFLVSNAQIIVISDNTRRYLERLTRPQHHASKVQGCQ